MGERSSLTLSCMNAVGVGSLRRRAARSADWRAGSRAASNAALLAPGMNGVAATRVVVKTVVNRGIAWSGLTSGRALPYSELGARTRIRTRDQLIKSQLLYQLSYAGAPVILFAESSSACRRNHGHPPALLSKLLSNPQNCCQTSRRRKGQIAGVSGPRLRRQLTLGPDSIATFIWMIARLDEFFISVNRQSLLMSGFEASSLEMLI